LVSTNKQKEVLEMYTIIGRESCINCEKIKQLLKEKEIAFEYVMMDELPKVEKFNHMNSAKKAGQMSLPIVLKDGVFMPTKEVAPSSS
jgi:glutaredoxin